jgi:hypothetical protein
MKTLYAILTASLISNVTLAKTYTVGSGKWTDAKIWNNEYPGTTIKSDDVVIITGQITMNTGIVVEGTLQVDKGGFMVGMKDLVIAKSGKFVNNGNTVMKRIVNEGTINNNLIMEAMFDVDNKGNIDNNNNMVTGNNFDNMGGQANGYGGSYYVNNNILTSPAATFGHNVNVFYGSNVENSVKNAKASSLSLDASYKNNNGVVLSVANPEKLDVSLFSIEKSTDGKTFTLVQTISDINKNSAVAMNYTDSNIDGNLTYYRIKAIGANGEETTLPVAVVKAPVANN